jgi:hypothetical protein
LAYFRHIQQGHGDTPKTIGHFHEQTGAALHHFGSRTASRVHPPRILRQMLAQFRLNSGAAFRLNGPKKRLKQAYFQDRYNFK